MEISRRVILIVCSYLLICTLVVFTSGKQENHAMNADPAEQALIEGGKNVWQDNGCVVCHSVYGLGGHLGPDLTNVFSRMGETYIDTIVHNGLKKMPAYTLSTEDTQSLVAYFKYLDQLGKYPLHSVTKESFGNNS